MLQLKPISPFSQREFVTYEKLRPVYMSEGHYVNQFIWQNYYQTQYATDELALYLFMETKGHHGAFAPLCKESDLPEVFRRMESFFEDTWKETPIFYNADTTMIQILEKNHCLEQYRITPDRDSFDYIYAADKLRTLAGKKMHKKKNHLNGFLREYEGHCQYETLHKNDLDEIIQFHEEWLDERRVNDKYHCIDEEEDGIYRLFENYDSIDYRIGGVRIDGQLCAYSIGSYIPSVQCAIIHVEKADTQYKGLYTYINQQFLIHEFPNAVFVNREDDLGQENLRQAKLSYHPVRLEEKYTIRHI